MTKREAQLDDIRDRIRACHADVALEVVHDDAYVPILRRLAEAMTDFGTAPAETARSQAPGSD